MRSNAGPTYIVAGSTYIVRQYYEGLGGWLFWCAQCGHRIPVSEYEPRSGKPIVYPERCPTCGRHIGRKYS